MSAVDILSDTLLDDRREQYELLLKLKILSIEVENFPFYLLKVKIEKKTVIRSTKKTVDFNFQVIQKLQEQNFEKQLSKIYAEVLYKL